jgi:hypothetical protein
MFADASGLPPGAILINGPTPQQFMPQQFAPQPFAPRQTMPQQTPYGRPQMAAGQPAPIVRGHSQELPPERPSLTLPPPERLGVSLPSPEALGVADPATQKPAPAASPKPQPAPQPAAGVDWAPVQARLQELRATGAQLDLMPGGGFRFTFVLPCAQPGQGHRVEARAATDAEAVRLALEQAAAVTR